MPTKKTPLWYVEVLRWTTFLPDIAEPKNLTSWWPRVSGLGKSDEAHRQPVGHSESGTIGQDVLRLHWAPGRIDWILTRKEDESETARQLTPLEEARKRFRTFIDRWTKQKFVPAAKRLALGCIIAHPVPTREDGYRFLAPFVSKFVKLSPNDSRDFFYQINRPRSSKTKRGVEINRLSKWMTSQTQAMHINITPAQVVSQKGDQVATAARAEFDVNTEGKLIGEFTPSQQMALFDEFDKLIVELSTKGDIR